MSNCSVNSNSDDDDEEFFDAEEITPSKINNKLHTKNEINRLANTDIKEKEPTVTIPSQIVKDIPKESVKDTVDINTERNFGQGRRKFHELRQFMQTEEDDCGQSTPSSQTSSVEGVFPTTSKTAHPFRIIEHDKISIQSLTSLGRIGRILNGSVDPSGVSLGRESQLSGGFTSTISEGSSEMSVIQNVEEPSTDGAMGMQMQEPDVIASTKSNSLKHSQVPNYEQVMEATSQTDSAPESLSIENQSLPIAPPRKRKKLKSESTQPVLPLPDPPEPVPPEVPAAQKVVPTERPERPSLKELNVKPPTLSEILNDTMVELSSPASTIESLTREFQNSLDMTMSSSADKVFNTSKESFVETNVFSGRHNSPTNKSEASSRSSTIKSIHSNNSGSSTKGSNSLDIKSAVKGQYVVKPQDEEKSRAAGPSKAELDRLDNIRKAFNNNMLENKNKSKSNFNTSSLGGHSSLGSSNRGSSTTSDKSSKERRKSAGDEDILKQLNMCVRTRTDSGKELTDMEILAQVTVLNLDTGERVPLSVAEDKLPQCINPLSLHIMRLTSEYVSNSSLYDDDKHRESDEESIMGRAGGSVGDKSSRSVAGSIAEGMDENATGGLKKRTARLKRFLGSTVKKTVNKAKSFAAEVSHARHKEDVADIIDEVRGEQNIKLKASNSHKGPYDFDGSIRHVQEFSDHVGPVWCMKFSQCGRLLATAGQDKVLRIWVIKDAYTFFQDMRTKYNAKQKSSPTPSQESLVSHQSINSGEDSNHSNNPPDSPSAPFMPKPFCVYTGHTSDLLDVSWSKNYFVLSSSMDKTVRLWHISRKECLCCFQHIDFVTAIVFHPRDDRYFLSGSLDGKLRLWNIPDKKVAVWNEVDGQTKLITAANFCQNGKFAVVGSYDGRCIFYTTDQLKYHTQIDVRSTRGKNSTGRKISGIEPMPGEDKILVTSNDSRIRLYDLRDLSLSCKYKGYVNVSSQIKASFSHDGKYIVSGSENQCIYIWKTHHDYSKFTSVRRDRNDFWEGIKAHNAVVTCAVFAPNPENIVRMIDEREQMAKGTGPLDIDPDKVEDPMVEQHTKGCGGHVLVSADFNGCIKVFVNKTKPKHSSLPVSALA